jgi:hypothetical protein
MAGPAGAVSGTFDCLALQGALDAASNGDVITLKETCTSSNSGPAMGSFTLKSDVRITLEGTAEGAFDGAGAPTRILTGTNVGETVIRNLTFRNGTAPEGEGGGAILLTGNSSPTIDRVTFHSNTASTVGGALAVLTTPEAAGGVTVANSTFGAVDDATRRNAADNGGAVYVETLQRVDFVNDQFLLNLARVRGGGVMTDMSGSTSVVSLTASVFDSNRARAGGGGAHLCCGPLRVENNLIARNVVSDPEGTFADHHGGGLAVISTAANGPGTILQASNLFQSNRIEMGGGGTRSAIGGGQWIGDGNLQSRHDRFVSNAVQGGASSRGAGLAADSCPSGPVTIRGDSLVAAGNSLGAPGQGAGVFAGCGGGAVHLNLQSSTVAGNAVGGPDVAAVAGQGADTLTLRNTIVFGGLSQAGFGTISALSSDVCTAAGTALDGAGNICADPQLIAPGAGDVRQQAGSPTIDAGSNSFVAEGLVVDIEGNPRITDGNGDGAAVVDIGADESGAVAEAPRAPNPGESSSATAEIALGLGQLPAPFVAPPGITRRVYVASVRFRAGQRGLYLVIRISSKSKRKRVRIRIRVLDRRGRSHSVVRVIRANRDVTVRGVMLAGAHKVRVSVLGTAK